MVDDDFEEPPVDADPERIRQARAAMLALFSGEAAPVAQAPKKAKRDPLTIAVWGDLAREDRAQVSANLAVAIARLGSRVVLVNPGLVPEQQKEMFGFLKALDTSSAPLMETGIPKLLVSPGRVGDVRTERDAHQDALEILRNVANADVDVAVFDCAANDALDTRDLFDLADHRLLVVRPGVTGIAATYSFIKLALARFVREALTEGDDRELFDAMLKRAPKTTSDMVRFLDEERAELGEWVEGRVSAFRVTIVGHQLKGKGDVDSLYAFARMLGEFLSVKASVLALEGVVRMHRNIGSAEGQELLALAHRLVAADVGELRSERFTEADEGLPGPVSKYLRRHDRCAVQWTVGIVAGGTTGPGIVQDVSIGGVLVVSRDTLRPGQHVTLQIESLGVELAGEVRRVAGDRAGIEFDKGIPREVIEQVMVYARGRKSSG